jgi:hypothetical protein
LIALPALGLAAGAIKGQTAMRLRFAVQVVQPRMMCAASGRRRKRTTMCISDAR